MGGRGSGNRSCRDKAQVVETCWVLDANRFMREGILRAQTYQTGRWIWYRDATRTEEASSICYEVWTAEREGWLRLAYTTSWTREAIAYRVRLTTTRPHLGGLRWWFA